MEWMRSGDILPEMKIGPMTLVYRADSPATNLLKSA
jgi:hypothetical protein